MRSSFLLWIVVGCALLRSVVSRETEDDFAEFEFDLPADEEEEGMVQSACLLRTTFMLHAHTHRRL